MNGRSVNTMANPFGGWTCRTNSSNTAGAGLMGRLVTLHFGGLRGMNLAIHVFFYRGILAMT